MNKFSRRLAVAVMTCAAVGLAACQEEKKPEEKPAATAPAPAAETAPEAKSETPSAPAAEPAAEPSAPAPAATPEPEKSEAPAAPAPEAAPEPEKKSEAPAESAPQAAAPAAEPPKEAETPAASPPAATAETPAATPPAATAETPAATPPAATATETPAATPPAATTETPAATPPAAATETPPATPPAATAEAPATPEDIKDRTSPPDPVSELAKQEGFKFEDGRYRNKDGDPQFIVTKGYMVDWGTWNGFRRYHDACHVCHGPNALGSTFAPSLGESLKTIDYNTFIATVSGGKRENKGGTEFVMPSFGEDRNIMCYIDDIYTYIKARSANMTDSTTGMPPGRPNNREDISPEAKKAADDCTG